MSTTEKILFEKNGYVIFRNIVPKMAHPLIHEEIARVHANYIELKREMPDLHKLGEWSIRGPHLVSQPIANIISSEPIKDICRKLIGENVDIYFVTTAAKPPHHGKAFPWHQDAGYGRGPRDYITFWYALDDVGEHNGCIRVKPGSHRTAIFPHENRRSTEESYGGPFLSDVIAEDDAVPVIMQAGDVLCMHSKLIHSSQTNKSASERRALISAYVRQCEMEAFQHEIDETPIPLLRMENLT